MGPRAHHPRLPQIRTCRFPASGSSSEPFARPVAWADQHPEAGHLTQTNTRFLDGTDKGVGSLCFASDTTAIISGFTLTGGYADIGGAIQSHTDSDLTLSDVTITGNHATSVGGGIYMAYADSLTIENCTVTGNSAVSYGGGLAAFSDRGYVYDTTISSNTVGDE